jgi:hypothetical protein
MYSFSAPNLLVLLVTGILLKGVIKKFYEIELSKMNENEFRNRFSINFV